MAAVAAGPGRGCRGRSYVWFGTVERVPAPGSVAADQDGREPVGHGHRFLVGVVDQERAARVDPGDVALAMDHPLVPGELQREWAAGDVAVECGDLFVADREFGQVGAGHPDVVVVREERGCGGGVAVDGQSFEEGVERGEDLSLGHGWTVNAATA